MKNRTPETHAPVADEVDLLNIDPDFPDVGIEFSDIEIEFPDFDVDAPPPARAATTAAASPPITMPVRTGKSVRTTIRLPRVVMEEFKRRATVEGKGYQTLIVLALREWLASAPASATGAG